MSDPNDATPDPDELADGSEPTTWVPAPPLAPGWPDVEHPTTWIAPAPTAPVGPAPTVVTDAETRPWAGAPTSVDPLVAPAAPAAPAPFAAPGGEPTAFPPSYAPPAPAPGGWATAPPPAYPPPTYPPRYAPQYAGGPPPPGVAGWGAVPMAPKPGVVPLRPLGVGEILDGAISYIRRDPKTVLGISAIISLVLALVQFLALAAASSSFSVSTGSTGSGSSTGSFTSSDSSADLLSSLGGLSATLIQTVVSSVLGVVATGLLTIVMGQAVLGRRVTMAEAWTRTRSRFWALLGLTLLVSLATGAVAIVGIGGAIALGVLVGSSVDPGIGVLLGIAIGLAGVVVTAWIYIKLLLAPVALMLEGIGIGTAMRRSWILVKGAWWRTFGIYLLGSILAGIVSSVLTVPFTLIGTFASFSAFEEGGGLPLAYTLSVSVATLISSMIVLPFSAGIVSLLYIDRRIRREALDLELARAAGVGA